MTHIPDKEARIAFIFKSLQLSNFFIDKFAIEFVRLLYGPISQMFGVLIIIHGDKPNAIIKNSNCIIKLIIYLERESCRDGL